MNFIYFTFHFTDGTKETFYSEGYTESLKKAQKIAEERKTRIARYEIKFKEE